MPIGAGGVLGATLMLSVALGAGTASAQTPSNGAWTDPPARAATPAPPPAAASPVKEPELARKLEIKSEIKPDTASRAETSPSSAARHAAVPARRRMREARHARPRVVADAPRVRIATPRRVVRREAAPSRVAARLYAPRTFAAPPYPYAPLPVGRVAGPVDGERTLEFSDGGDRMRRIAAAQAAGYLVVRARSVQYPDGRMLRSYRPYDDHDDGLD